MFYMFLAPGFEEVEALCPLDLARRAGIDVVTVGIGGASVRGAHGITVTADLPEGEFIYDGACEGVILPGGMPGTRNLAASPVVASALDKAYASGAFICAICAAPSVPGGRGMLRGVRAVCYPGYGKELLGALPSRERAVRDGRFITAVGMGASVEFGLLIVAAVKGDAAAAKLGAAVLAPSFPQ